MAPLGLFYQLEPISYAMVINIEFECPEPSRGDIFSLKINKLLKDEARQELHALI